MEAIAKIQKLEKKKTESVLHTLYQDKNLSFPKLSIKKEILKIL